MNLIREIIILGKINFGLANGLLKVRLVLILAGLNIRVVLILGGLNTKEVLLLGSLNNRYKNGESLILDHKIRVNTRMVIILCGLNHRVVLILCGLK